jgi:hypothetical protein
VILGVVRVDEGAALITAERPLALMEANGAAAGQQAARTTSIPI